MRGPFLLIFLTYGLRHGSPILDGPHQPDHCQFMTQHHAHAIGSGDETHPLLPSHHLLDLTHHLSSVLSMHCSHALKEAGPLRQRLVRRIRPRPPQSDLKGTPSTVEPLQHSSGYVFPKRCEASGSRILPRPQTLLQHNAAHVCAQLALFLRVETRQRSAFFAHLLLVHMFAMPSVASTVSKFPVPRTHP